MKKANASKEDLVVYVGRIQSEKGINDIIKALALVKSTSVRAKIMDFLFNRRVQHLVIFFSKAEEIR